MKIGDLVRYRTATHHADHSDWLGIIVREGPVNIKLKTVQWVHKSGGVDRGSYHVRDLVLVNENR